MNICVALISWSVQCWGNGMGFAKGMKAGTNWPPRDTLTKRIMLAKGMRKSEYVTSQIEHIGTSPESSSSRLDQELKTNVSFRLNRSHLLIGLPTS